MKRHLRSAFGAYRSDRFTLLVVEEWRAGIAGKIAMGTMAPEFYLNLRNLLSAIVDWARHPIAATSLTTRSAVSRRSTSRRRRSGRTSSQFRSPSCWPPRRRPRPMTRSSAWPFTPACAVARSSACSGPTSTRAVETADDLVLSDQLAVDTSRDSRLRLIVLDEELEPPAQHAALVVGVLDAELIAAELLERQRRELAGLRERGADADGRVGGGAGGSPSARPTTATAEMSAAGRVTEWIRSLSTLVPRRRGESRLPWRQLLGPHDHLPAVLPLEQEHLVGDLEAVLVHSEAAVDVVVVKLQNGGPDFVGVEGSRSLHGLEEDLATAVARGGVIGEIEPGYSRACASTNSRAPGYWRAMGISPPARRVTSSGSHCEEP